MEIFMGHVVVHLKKEAEEDGFKICFIAKK